jgi:hypothetical protein
MTVKPFYIKSEGLTDDRINEVLDKAVDCGARVYESKEGASRYTYPHTLVERYLYFGVDDENDTYVSDEIDMYGVGAVELTVDQVDEHLLGNTHAVPVVDDIDETHEALCVAIDRILTTDITPKIKTILIKKLLQ